jgi:hypothetical protein
MKTRAWTIAVAVMVLIGSARPAGAQVAAALQYVMENNLASFNRKDLTGTMNTIHTKSPDYESTKATLVSQFADLDVSAALVHFDYLGHDEEFAVARAKVKTTGKAATGFTDNTVDAIVIFHQENGDWKLWDEDILGTQLAP